MFGGKEFELVDVVEWIVTFSSDVHFLNAQSFIVITEEGIANCFIDTHLKKADSFIVVNEEESSKETFSNDEHSVKALHPIKVTDLGIIISDNNVHFENAP